MFNFLKSTFERLSKKIESAPAEEKKGIIDKVTSAITEIKLSEEKFEQLFSDFELELLQANVALEVVEKIKSELKFALVRKSLKRRQLHDRVKQELRKTLRAIFEACTPINLLELAKIHKPLILLFVGVNGVGKTTTLAKVAHWLKLNNLSCVFAASDTFRAAAIEQLEAHAKKLGIKVIKHKYGADAAAVAFDAIRHAEAKGIDVVLIDTAGRSHANIDLMDELAKVKRVSKPHLTILVVDALTGNDAVEQARLFNEKIGIDGSILTKIDADEKGGALISVAYITRKPILFLGVGQNYSDLRPFDAEELLDKILM